jgi:hypothetical protein
MKLVKVLVGIPQPIKNKLDALRQQGVTASGFIRSLLEQHFNQPQASKKGR